MTQPIESLAVAVTLRSPTSTVHGLHSASMVSVCCGAGGGVGGGGRRRDRDRYAGHTRMISNPDLPAELRAEIVVAVDADILPILRLRGPVDAGPAKKPFRRCHVAPDHERGLHRKVRRDQWNAPVYPDDVGRRRASSSRSRDDIVVEKLAKPFGRELQIAAGGELRTDAERYAAGQVVLIRIASLPVAEAARDLSDARHFFADDEVYSVTNCPVPEPSSAEPVGSLTMPRTASATGCRRDSDMRLNLPPRNTSPNVLPIQPSRTNG